MDATSMDIKNRVFLITGGTSGVGKATAMGLAKLGAKIVIVGRSAERCLGALKDIADATGNDRCDFLVADLSLQSSIRDASEEFKRKYDNLHVLANLGGAIFFERQLTREGLEKTLAVNYLSHFLLTSQLLDILKESRPARVITVAGAPGFLKNPKIDLSDLQFEKRFNGMRATAQAMFARVAFTFELAKRLEGTGVTALAFNPMVRSKLLRDAPWTVKISLGLMGRSAKADCPTGVYLAAAREVEKTSGAFFDHLMRIVPINEKYDPAMGRELWSLSEELTGISAVQQRDRPNS